ncbi:sulfotransferase [Oleiagrimonas sp. C23AA]|uniref:sulfotransferase family protein n=1 Tax=Oleiagrimonas sp. C23AA TaxID=2719047 RepID=UPI0014225F0F|nr:sulfotransferase [Oleiagrimonas sp. C23AA]NII12137.1 sulfotransferase [Oleiagrimonas sp. C23AA]
MPQEASITAHCQSLTFTPTRWTAAGGDKAHRCGSVAARAKRAPVALFATVAPGHRHCGATQLEWPFFDGDCMGSPRLSSVLDIPANAKGDAGEVSISFVCDAGRLEPQALLLAASLRAAHPTLRLVAAVPGTVQDQTIKCLQTLNVELEPISNPLDEAYRIGNKLAALGAGEPAGLRVFLDTDMLCMQPVDFSVLGMQPFAAKPADLATFGSDALWRTLYSRFDLPLPTARVVSTYSQGVMYPYFNAGMVASTRAGELAHSWADICRRIDAMDDIQPKRPWLDQIGLPLAVASLGLETRCLGEHWNYPAHIKPVQGSPALIHYHIPHAVAASEQMLGKVRELTVLFPWLGDVLKADASWARVNALIKHRRTAAAGRWPWRRKHSAGCKNPEMIITGIPRSGTSYLCQSLDALDNLAVINEPSVLFDGLRRGAEPWSVPLLHAELRAAIRAGDAVENKLDAQGRLTEDTAVQEVVRGYHPMVSGSDFVLATKNTLAYMARLDGLLHTMPDARIVACIRHPADTLASWKQTFAHLKAGDPTALPVGGLDDPYLPEHLRMALQAVAAIEHPAYRRAAWWQCLASELLRCRHGIAVVRYEDLVSQPEASLQRLLGSFTGQAGRRAQPLVASSPRTSRRQALDTDDWKAIRTLCAGVAEAFGYHDL